MSVIKEVTENMKDQAVNILEHTLAEFGEANGHWAYMLARDIDDDEVQVAVKIYKGYGKEEFEVQGYETYFVDQQRRVKANSKMFTIYIVPGGWKVYDATVH